MIIETMDITPGPDCYIAMNPDMVLGRSPEWTFLWLQVAALATKITIAPAAAWSFDTNIVSGG